MDLHTIRYAKLLGVELGITGAIACFWLQYYPALELSEFILNILIFHFISDILLNSYIKVNRRWNWFQINKRDDGIEIDIQQTRLLISMHKKSRFGLPVILLYREILKKTNDKCTPVDAQPKTPAVGPDEPQRQQPPPAPPTYHHDGDHDDDEATTSTTREYVLQDSIDITDIDNRIFAEIFVIIFLPYLFSMYNIGLYFLSLFIVTLLVI